LQGRGMMTGSIPAAGITDMVKESFLMMVACLFRKKNPLFTLCPYLYRRSSLPCGIAFRPLKITGTMCADPVDTDVLQQWVSCCKYNLQVMPTNPQVRRITLCILTILCAGNYTQ